MGQILHIPFSEKIKRVFSTTSIKFKLMVIIMSVSLIGLGTVGASILINELVSLNRMQEIDLEVMGEIVADTSAGYLVFDDESGASVALMSLRAKKQITRAILFNKHKKAFAMHVRGGGQSNVIYEDLKAQQPKMGEIFTVWKDVVVDGEIAGYLYLESDASLINEFIQTAVLGLIFIVSTGVLVAYLLASRMQKIISEPIEHLTETASRITASQDYSLRAEKESGDEIGVLTEEFNNMLTQLQKRNDALLESESRFREVVEQSVDALFLITDEGRLIDVNNAACESLGYSRSELLSLDQKQIDNVISSEDYIKQIFSETGDKDRLTIEGEHRRKDGTVIPVEVNLGYLNIEGEKLVLASARDMTERKQAQEKLQQANDMLEAKVNERTRELKNTNKALSREKEKAESANYAKSLFLANMSHEIRTPMNAVVGFTDVLAASELNDQQKNYVKSIQAGSRNLLSLINDILDLSKIEAGKMKVQYDQVYVRQLLNDIRQVFSITAKEKGLTLELKIDESVPDIIMSDEVRLRQILFNLLNNAIKFTHKGGVKVIAEYNTFSSEAMFYSLRISIQDTGIGIPKKDRENIFNVFEQQDNQNTREFGGAGLGLAICTRLADRLNSEISVESEINKGSIFHLLMREPEIVTKAADRQQEKSAKDVLFKEAKILIVDDVEANRMLLQEYMSDQPFEILEAGDGQSAIEIARQEKPDLILMDIRMPKMNGIEATKIIKSDADLAGVAVVAVTASVIEDKKADQKRSLFDAVLFKPLSSKSLKQCLMNLLSVVSVVAEEETGVDFIDRLNKEMESADIDFVEAFDGYSEVLREAQSMGSFAGINSLLDDICGLATEFKMDQLKQMIGRLRDANKQFDIEESQKLIGAILAGMKHMQEVQHD